MLLFPIADIDAFDGHFRLTILCTKDNCILSVAGKLPSYSETFFLLWFFHRISILYPACCRFLRLVMEAKFRKPFCCLLLIETRLE
ncbi:hypothetical protein CHL67_01565 [Prosthecochloris sp. GSB1]|nr:hypothetical protein CHL67_01565 [Prosthecochloris sp. GSB1]